jgi:anaerobic ribonucleoside-triphosphate reductase
LAMLAMRPDKEPFLPLSWTSHAICSIGLAELAQIVTGEPIENSPQAQTFAADVVAHLNAEAERLSAKHKVRFLLAESRDLTAPHRLARLDANRFGLDLVKRALNRQALNRELTSEITGEEDEIFYTNSTKLPSSSEISSGEKLRIEGVLQGKAIWGAASEIWLGQTLPPSDQLSDFVRQAFQQTKITAITFSPEFSVCTVCRTVSRGRREECPQCGATRVDGLAQATNRYSFTSNWPHWKLAELNLRKYKGGE